MYYFLVVIFFLFNSLDAYIYQAIIMKKWNDLRNRYHYVIGLGDYHIKHDSVIKKQHNQLRSLLTNMDAQCCKVITEDLSVPNVDGRCGSGKFRINSRGGFLGGITEKCRNMGLDADNFEYRYARVCSIGPVLKDVTKDPKAYPSVVGISVGDVVKEIKDESQKIVKFDDGRVLNDWYRASVEQVDKKIVAYGLTDHKMSMADYLASKQNNPTLLEKLLTFDRALLDAHIVHSVVNTNKENICLLAGGSHIERVSQMLEKVGYKRVLELPKINAHAARIESSLQSESGASDNMSIPYAIDLSGFQNLKL